MNFLVELIVYYSVRLLTILVCVMPAAWAMALGKVCGKTYYWFARKRRRQVYQNLRVAFSAEKSLAEIRKITGQVFSCYGQNIMGVLRLPCLTRERLKKYVTVDGGEHVQSALQKKKGLILLTMHSGSWEIGSLGSALLGAPYHVLVKPQSRFRRLNNLLNSYRSSQGAQVLERGMGTRELIRSLRRNEIVGMVVDQGGRKGELVPFFGRQASLSSGAVRIAMKTGTPICFAVIRRTHGPNHHLKISKPMVLERSGDEKKDRQINLNRIARMMEGHIRKAPAEYMWSYKIWKYSPQRVIGILDDGRTGHLRQSQAVARILSGELEQQGYQPDTRMMTVEYKNRWTAGIFAIIVFLSGRRMSPFLQRFLTAGSYAQVAAVKADYLISCGSAGASVNDVLGHDLGAKRIAILKPALLEPAWFDLVIMPEHDRNREREYSKKVIFTKGAPNLITEKYLAEQGEALLKRFSHLKMTAPLRIGVLLGGDTKHFVLGEKRVRVVIHQLKEVAEDLHAEILLTTSRRTSAKVEALINRELRRYPRCPLVILPNRNNVPEAVGGILALSDILVVSGDSISMISEAACAGKKTIVFPVQSRALLAKPDYKHNRFIDILNERGYILSADSKNIKTAIYNLVKNKIQLRILDDNRYLRTAIKRIL